MLYHAVPPARSAAVRAGIAGLVVLGSLAYAQAARRGQAALAAPAAGANEHPAVKNAPQGLREVAAELDRLLPPSRRVLLGQRKADSPSCVQRQPKRGRAMLLADRHGGPGTRIVSLYKLFHHSAEEAYTWHQTDLRSAVKEMQGWNDLVLPRVEALSASAGRLAAEVRRWKRCPEGLRTVEPTSTDHWPGRCLARLNEAVKARDPAACRRWAGELHSATFALADLHRWLAVLLENHLLALDFQARCQTVFAWANPPYEQHHTFREDYFPGCYLWMARTNNYLEVEHQAEGIFSVPAAYTAKGAADLADAPAAVWMPPDVRAAFRLIRSRLTPATQGLWDAAAAAPYERSCLANLLFRASKANALDDLSVVLKRFERAGGKPTVVGLMDVMFYRAGVWVSGNQWADRYDTRLMRPAGRLSGTPEQLLRQACGLTHKFLGDWSNYRGEVVTLEQSLTIRKMDCVRATDMMGALFRDAGGSGYHLVRLSGGLGGHTMGAVPAVWGGEGVLMIADPLAGNGKSHAWPSAYYRGYTWPAGYPGNRLPIFAAELTARGLDGYLFAEGYVVRGPQAGTLVRAALPYLPDRRKASVAKVYPGPYPKVHALRLLPRDPHLGRAAPRRRALPGR